MANELQTINMITLKALDYFVTQTEAVKVFDQKHSKSFGNKGRQQGDSQRIRKPDPGTVRRNQTYAATDVKEQYDTLTLDKPYGSDFVLSMNEMSLDINDIGEQIIKPRVHAIAAAIDQDILEELYFKANHSIGTPGTALTNTGNSATALSSFTKAGAKLTEYTAPRGPGQRHVFVGPDTEEKVSTMLREDFNSQTVISKQNQSQEMMGYRYGMNWHADQSVYRATTGSRATAAGVDVDGASQTGSTLTIDALGAAKRASKGDRFTIAGVNAVNPVTKADLGFLKQFTVTARTAANATSLSFTPAIVTSGSHQNVSAGPGDGAQITWVGGAAKTSDACILAHKSAVTIAFAPLEPTGKYGALHSMKHDPDTGIGINCTAQFDIDNYRFKFRLDVLAGFLVQRPEFACVVFD